MAEDFYSQAYTTFYEKLLKEEGLLSEDGMQRARAWHCDPLVLHAPGVCAGCDRYSDRQQSRINRHVNFTGEYLPDRTSCPSEYFRPADLIHRWRGNRPSQKLAVEEGPTKLVMVSGSTLQYAPEPTETVVITYNPQIHDLATEVDPPGVDGKVVATFRPKPVEDDSQKDIVITVNGIEHSLPETRVSYHTIVEFLLQDSGGSRPLEVPLYTIKYEGTNSRGILRPFQAITAENGMVFRATVTGDA